MNAEHNDPIFNSLDRLAGLADDDVVGDRMSDIRRRVRVTRQRRMAGAGVAAAAVLAAGFGLSQLVAKPAEIQPALPGPDVDQVVAIDAKAVYSDLIRLRVIVEGKSTSYTDAAGDSVPAGPLNFQIVVDGEVVKETKAADVTCEKGGEVSLYDVSYPAKKGRFLTATVSGPGEHTIEVRAPYCADGHLIDEPSTHTVTTVEGEPIVREEKTADVDGDGQDDTIQVVSPAEGELGAWDLVVQRSDGTTISEPLPEESEWSLQDPQDLDVDGTAEIIVTGGGGETWLGGVYQVDGEALRLVPTRNEAGQEEPLAFGVSEGTPQDVTYQIRLADSGFLSYRYQEATPTRPAPVDVRRWVLTDGTLTLQDATERGCVDADFNLRLGGC